MPRRRFTSDILEAMRADWCGPLTVKQFCAKYAISESYAYVLRDIESWPKRGAHLPRHKEITHASETRLLSQDSQREHPQGARSGAPAKTSRRNRALNRAAKQVAPLEDVTGSTTLDRLAALHARMGQLIRSALVFLCCVLSTATFAQTPQTPIAVGNPPGTGNGMAIDAINATLPTAPKNLGLAAVGLTVTSSYFGAQCVGSSHDDTAALNTALSWSATNKFPVWFPANCYSLTGVTMPAGAAIRGTINSGNSPTGSSLTCPTSAAACITRGSSGSETPTSIDGLIVTGGTKTIYLLDGYNVVDANLVVQGGTDCLYLYNDNVGGGGLTYRNGSLQVRDCSHSFITQNAWPELFLSQARFGTDGSGDVTGTDSFFYETGGNSGTAGGPNTMICTSCQFNVGATNANPTYMIHFSNIPSSVDLGSFRFEGGVMDNTAGGMSYLIGVDSNVSSPIRGFEISHFYCNCTSSGLMSYSSTQSDYNWHFAHDIFYFTSASAWSLGAVPHFDLNISDNYFNVGSGGFTLTSATGGGIGIFNHNYVDQSGASLLLSGTWSSGFQELGGSVLTESTYSDGAGGTLTLLSPYAESGLSMPVLNLVGTSQGCTSSVFGAYYSTSASQLVLCNGGKQFTFGSGGQFFFDSGGAAINSTDFGAFNGGNNAVSSFTFKNGNSGGSAASTIYLANSTSNTEASFTLNGGGNSSGNGVNSLTINNAGGLWLQGGGTNGLEINTSGTPIFLAQPTMASSTTGAGAQTFTNSPCAGLTTEKWIPVSITGQSGTWYVPACQ